MKTKSDRATARVVARAWVDPAYKERLLEDGSQAIAELGYIGAQGEHMIVLENMQRCTTWWCVPYAPVTRGQFWVCHPSGISPHRIDHGR